MRLIEDIVEDVYLWFCMYE